MLASRSLPRDSGPDLPHQLDDPSSEEVFAWEALVANWRAEEKGDGKGEEGRVMRRGLRNCSPVEGATLLPESWNLGLIPETLHISRIMIFLSMS